MKGCGAASSCKEKGKGGGEGWEKGKEVKGPSREQGRVMVMATRVEGKKNQNNNPEIKIKA